MTYAEKVNGVWVQKSPRQFRKDQNKSIPDPALEDEGLFEITIDPKPPITVTETATQGPIIDRSGRPVIGWVITPVPSERLNDLVNRENTRRITKGFTFNGVDYDFDSKSQARITGAATLAGFAIGAGKLAGDYFWANATEGFAWIAQDNSVVPMDAQTCFAFGQAAAGHESAHVFAAYSLKAIGVPVDYSDDKYWP